MYAYIKSVKSPFVMCGFALIIPQQLSEKLKEIWSEFQQVVWKRKRRIVQVGKVTDFCLYGTYDTTVWLNTAMSDFCIWFWASLVQFILSNPIFLRLVL